MSDALVFVVNDTPWNHHGGIYDLNSTEPIGVSAGYDLAFAGVIAVMKEAKAENTYECRANPEDGVIVLICKKPGIATHEVRSRVRQYIANACADVTACQPKSNRGVALMRTGRGTPDEVLDDINVWHERADVE